jgi:hypothetical protein
VYIVLVRKYRENGLETSVADGIFEHSVALKGKFFDSIYIDITLNQFMDATAKT